MDDVECFIPILQAVEDVSDFETGRQLDLLYRDGCTLRSRVDRVLDNEPGLYQSPTISESWKGKGERKRRTPTCGYSSATSHALLVSPAEREG